MADDELEKSLFAPLPMAVTAADGLPPGVIPYRLTVEQYKAIVGQGILNKYDPCELLEGLLVHRMRKTPPHVFATTLLAEAVGQLVPASEWFVSTHHPIVLPDSVPEPDVSLIRGGPRDYFARHPTVGQVPLIVEVADVSLERDRWIKRRIYARAGVPVYWIVVLPERIVEVYTAPSGPTADPAYAPPRRYADGDRVPVVIDGREIGTVAVADLLP